MKKPAEEHILGLDIGANSIGWALVAFEKGAAKRILRAGARCFEAGVEGDVASGRDESRAQKRREARLQRRQTERRARRIAKVARILQRAGLLPEGPIETSEQRLRFFTELDAKICSRYLQDRPKKDPERRRLAHVIPYNLRARALDERLEAHELGRALYHLAHRRGFLSNRRAPVKKDEKAGVVTEGITSLEQHMQEAGARTLGEYFAGLDPERQRIRERWTSRTMYEQEFEQIWEKQVEFYPGILTEELKRDLQHAIFYQRPLKSQKGRIGECQFEPGCRRAPTAMLEFQRFRMLQTINNLEIICLEDGLVRRLTQQERAKLIAELETKGDITFARARKVLGLRKSSYAFNLEQGGEKKLIGNKSAASLAKIFGSRWEDLSPSEREAVLEDVHSIQKEETLKRRAMQVWGLDGDGAEALSSVRLEDGYCNLSRKALRKILPELEKGRRYGEIVKELYPKLQRRAVECLPSVERSGIILRNPAVHRALTELRKVMNAIVREHGKPDKIRIELARDLRQPRKERKRRTGEMRKNQAAREAAKRRILEEMGDPSPSRTDILKVQLADECNWQCPYTGLQISWAKLLGSEPQFDIEHIIPYHRSLDDSFVNKTLCDITENRNVKKNRTPFEAYGATDRWDDIVERVKAFKGGLAREKFRRFRLQDLSEFEDFSTRLLNDTRYVSTLAADYLALLYGGLSDTEGVRRIQATKGGITAQLRNAWKLNALLGDGPGKSRDDHRHHAVDAIVVALTDPGTVKNLGKAAQRSIEKGKRRWWNYVDLPWEGFLEEAKQVIDSIIVSHRVSRKVTGPLHDETYYAHKRGSEYVHVRKAVQSLSKNDVNDIVDDKVRESVQDILGDGDPKKVFASAEDHPVLHARDGREIPIHRVRIRKKASVQTIAKGVRQRHVLTGSNHHVEIVEVSDRNGKPRWKGYVVTTFEAMRRLRAREPVVKRDHGNVKQFLFSLTQGDVMRIGSEDGQPAYVKVLTFWLQAGEARLQVRALSDGRPTTQDRGRSYMVTKLGKLQCSKVSVTPLGEVRRAND